MITSHINFVPNYFRNKMTYNTNTKLNLRVWPKERPHLEWPNPRKNFSEVMKIRYNEIGPEGVEFTPEHFLIRCSKCSRETVIKAENGGLSINPNECKDCIKVIPPKKVAAITFEPKKNTYWI